MEKEWFKMNKLIKLLFYYSLIWTGYGLVYDFINYQAFLATAILTTPVLIFLILVWKRKLVK